MRLYTVYDIDGSVSLEKVSMEHSFLSQVSPRVPLEELDVDDITFAFSGNQKFRITRVR